MGDALDEFGAMEQFNWCFFLIGQIADRDGKICGCLFPLEEGLDLI